VFRDAHPQRFLPSTAIGYNQCTGTIPAGLIEVWAPNMNFLHLDNNNLNGTLPTELGLMTRATELLLDGNLFDGTIPTELGLLELLRTLRLNGNRLTGSIPSEL
jgi:hypothetical protein